METKVVRFIKESKYERPSFDWNRYSETVHIYKLQDEDGKIYVWKTTGLLAKEERIYRDGVDWDCVTTCIPVDSVIKIKFSIKEESEYKGEKQTVIQRVKVLEIIYKAQTEEEKREVYKENQLDSLQEGDFIWKRMPYRQYKNHYADCEKIIDSYNCEEGTIDVIIRAGRLKNSGVRGQCYYYWVFKDDTKELVRTIKAVSFENAYNRVTKENPGHEWDLDHFEIVSHGW